MAYACMRWPILFTPSIPSITLQVPEKTISQPNAPAMLIQQGEAVVQAMYFEARKEQRKRRKARKKQERREKKQKAIEDKAHEMAAKAEPTMQELDDVRKQTLEKGVTMNQNITSRRAAKQQMEHMEVENKINEVVSKTKADMQELVEAEKKKAERYLSLARKYYRMWKILNEQQKRAWISKSQGEDSKYNVRSRIFMFSLFPKSFQTKRSSNIGRLKRVSSTFEDLGFDGPLSLSLSVDATILGVVN